MTVRISGLPNLSQNGHALTANEDGSFTLTVHSATAASDLAGLTTTPAASFEDSIPFHVAVTAHDGAVDSATVSHQATLTVNPLPETPVFTAAAVAIDEDGTSAVTISIANLAELTEDGTDTLTVKISGLPNLSQNGHAVTANEDGSFTLTVHSATAASDLSGLTTTPAASFEGSIPFNVAVTAHDGTVDSATISHQATLTVNPLPETPVFYAAAVAINEDGTSALTISIANLAELTEDGTDTVTVRISGLLNLSQNGEALTANHDGSFSLTVHSVADLSGLTTTPAASFETSIPFHVAVTAHDGGIDSATVSHDATAIVSETDPSLQTIILAKSPIVLAQGINTNSLGLHTETFDNLPPSSSSGNFHSDALDATFSASGDLQVLSGGGSPPFMGPLPGALDTTRYLNIDAGGKETITFATEKNEFGLYWGSVDTFNTIAFYHGTTLVASYTGVDIAPLFSDGNQVSFTSNGYVEFLGLASFDKVVLGSNDSSFELDNISAGFVPPPAVELASPITGTLTVSDANVGDTLSASLIGNAVVTYNGSTTLPSGADVAALIDPSAVTFDTAITNGGLDVLHWTYHPTNPHLDFLEPGDTLSITFEARVNDGHVTAGDQSLTVTFVGNGASVVNGTSQNDMFANVGGNVTIFGNGGQDTFAFNTGFGHATIADFDVHNDTIEINHALFATVSAILAGAHSANSGHDTIITDAAHDTITLTGVALAQLQAGNFHLV